MRTIAVAVFAAWMIGCAGAGAGRGDRGERSSPVGGGAGGANPPLNVSLGASAGAKDDAIAKVAAIHGGAGPWAIAGYRMGAYALQKLGLARQSFDLEVVHHTPAKVQYSCIADGASAATGASAGKLNLKLVDAADAEVATTYRKKSTGETITLRPTASFAERFKDVPREKLGDAGRAVMDLPDAAIFEEVPTPDAASAPARSAASPPVAPAAPR